MLSSLMLYHAAKGIKTLDKDKSYIRFTEPWNRPREGWIELVDHADWIGDANAKGELKWRPDHSHPVSLFADDFVRALGRFGSPGGEKFDLALLLAPRNLVIFTDVLFHAPAYYEKKDRTFYTGELIWQHATIEPIRR